MSGKALIAVIPGRAARRIDGIGGVSDRRVDDQVQAMGLPGISHGLQASQGLSGEADRGRAGSAFPERPPEGEWPHLWLDASYLTGPASSFDLEDRDHHQDFMDPAPTAA